MSIQRVPAVPFTQIANSALRDRRLSFKARGLLALVLSNVGEWNATLKWLVAQSDQDGRASIQAALNELTELGYRVVEKQHENGSADIRTIVTWFHEPKEPISRPTENLTVREPDGRETRAPIEDHSIEHHVSEEHGQATSETATPPSDPPPLRADVEQLCEHLADQIEANGSLRPKINKQWRDAARLMLDRDGRTFNDVMGAIAWSQNDEFWRTNVLSMPTLRKQFDKLRLAAQRQSKPTNLQENIALLRRTAYNEGYEVVPGQLEIGGDPL